jgi:hypothetical protein
MGGFKLTNLGAATVGTDAVRLSQLQAGTSQLLAVSGTDTLTALGTPTVTAYATGNLFYFVAAATNTTSVTLNVDGLGAKAVTRHGSTALVAGDILTGEVCLVVYDGTRFQLLNPDSYTNLNVSGNLTLNGGTANGVAYLNGSKALTSGSALVFDGTNLGIGTSSPARRLHVVAADGVTNSLFAGASYALRVQSIAATGTVVDAVNNTESTYQPLLIGGSQTQFMVSGAEKARLVSDHFLLGATANPGVLNTSVVIDSGANSLGGVVMQNNTTGRTSSDGGYLCMVGAEMRLYNAESNALLFGTNNTERARLDSSGNLGIGTSSPTSKLVVSNAGAQGFEFDPANGILQVYNRSTSAYGELRPYGSLIRFFTGASPVETMRITADGNIVAGASAALATTATNGFLYVPTCAGTPTGTPTAITGMAPIVVNTTNNKLYFYSGGAWRDAGP